MKDANHHNEPVTNKMFDKNSGNKTWKTTAIVFIVLVVLLSAVGVYGYLQIKKLNKQLQDQKAQITELSDTKKTLEDAASAAASAAAKVVVKASTSSYLEVKELGYKLPLSDDIKDLQYFVNGSTTFFSTGSLQSKAWGADKSDPGKYCSLGTLPLGAVSKFANAADAGPTQQKALSGFVLGFAPPQANCSNNQATIDLQTAQKASFIKAFDKAEKI